MKQSATISYPLRLSRDLLAQIKLRAGSEERTIANMIRVLIRQGLDGSQSEVNQ